MKSSKLAEISASMRSSAPRPAFPLLSSEGRRSPRSNVLQIAGSRIGMLRSGSRPSFSRMPTQKVARPSHQKAMAKQLVGRRGVFIVLACKMFMIRDN